jgi:hypothetical protein
LLLFDQDYEFDVHAPRFIVYRCMIDSREEEYVVPYFGIISKIIDFGNSSLPEKGIISAKAVDKRQIYERTQLDMLLLFHWIHTACVSTGNKDITGILEQLDPTKSYILYNTEYIMEIYDTIPTLKDMMLNSMFEAYKNKSISSDYIYNTYG